jgi:predicted nucleotide-binding protein
MFWNLDSPRELHNILRTMPPNDAKRLPPSYRRKALAQLSKSRLSEITEHFDLDVGDRRVLDNHINALVRSRIVEFNQILELLSQKELKTICEALGLDPGGREKALLVERILSGASGTPSGEQEPSEEGNKPLSDVLVFKESTDVKVLAPRQDSKRIFIIYGRNHKAVSELKKFLNALGLRDWTFDQVSFELGPNPVISDIVRRGVSGAQAVIALFTPDEYVSLEPMLRFSSDDDKEVRRWQPRPNVLYEAGLAMGMNKEGTLFVTIGKVDLPSDLDGIHRIRLNNSNESRHLLRKRLEAAGCEIDTGSSIEWLSPAVGGDFELAVVPHATHRDPFEAAQSKPEGA